MIPIAAHNGLAARWTVPHDLAGAGRPLAYDLRCSNQRTRGPLWRADHFFCAVHKHPTVHKGWAASADVNAEVNRSNSIEATVKPLADTFALFDAVPFWLVPFSVAPPTIWSHGPEQRDNKEGKGNMNGTNS